MQIRAADKGDIDNLVSMLVELFSIEDDFIPDRQKHRDALNMILDRNDRAAVFVSLDGQGITGMVSAQLLVSTASGGHSVLLEDLYVVPESRGKGGGRALLNEVLRWGREHGALRVQLVADERNTPAIEFYRKAGFGQSHMTAFYMKLVI